MREGPHSMPNMFKKYLTPVLSVYKAVILILLLYFPTYALANYLPKVVKDQLAIIDTFMLSHPDLIDTLRSDDDGRKKIYAYHRIISKMIEFNLTSSSQQNEVFDWYKRHIELYSTYYKHRSISQIDEPYLAMLRFQVWMNLYDTKVRKCKPIKLVNKFEDRKAIADVIGFEENSLLSNILLEKKLLLSENLKATSEELNRFNDFLNVIPRDIFSVRYFYIRSYLGKGEALREPNVLTFVPDTTRLDMVEKTHLRLTEYAINLGDNWYLENRFLFLLHMAAGDDVIVNSLDYKFSLADTQNVFAEKGYWDGNPDTWESSWKSYWSTGLGDELNKNWLYELDDVKTSDIRESLEKPQFIISNIAKLYYFDSEAMFKHTLDLWQQSFTVPINQFLAFVLINKKDKNHSRFYTFRDGIKSEDVQIALNENGYVHYLIYAQLQYEFVYDENAMVVEIQSKPVNL